MKIQIFWNILHCVCWWMGTGAVEKVVASIVRFHALSFDYCDLEDRGSWLLQNRNNFIPFETMSHSRRLESFIDTTVITSNLTVYVFLAGYNKYSCENRPVQVLKMAWLVLVCRAEFLRREVPFIPRWHVQFQSCLSGVHMHACSHTLFLL